MRGQIGSYLYDLLKKDCEVFGTTRGETKLPYLHCNLTDEKEVKEILELVRPDEVYNMASETNTENSIKNPVETLHSNGTAVMILCLNLKNYFPKTKLFQACSSEIFRGLKELITPELTSVHPLTPYAIAKCVGYWTVKYYRESFSLPFYNGIIFTTDSGRRNDGFLTTKIAQAILTGEKLKVRCLTSRRNWLHAEDVAKGIILCMSGQPREYVFSTGTTNSVKNLVDIAYNLSGISLVWEGKKGYSTEGKILVESNEENLDEVVGQDKELEKMGWKPLKNIEDIMKEILLKPCKTL